MYVGIVTPDALPKIMRVNLRGKAILKKAETAANVHLFIVP